MGDVEKASKINNIKISAEDDKLVVEGRKVKKKNEA